MGRLKIIVSVFLLLSIGFLIGAIGSRMLMKHRIEKNFLGDEPPGVRFFNKITDRLDLSPSQEATINDIVGQAREELLAYREKCRPEFRKLIHETMDKIVAELDDSQKRKLDRYTERFKKRGRRSRRHPPPPPPPSQLLTPEEVIEALGVAPEHQKEFTALLAAHLAEKKQKEKKFRKAHRHMKEEHRAEMDALYDNIETQLKAFLTDEELVRLRRLLADRKPPKF